MALSSEYNHILNYFIQGEYFKAREELESLVKAQPDNTTFLLLLGRCNLALKNIQEAEKIYKNLASSTDPQYITEKSEADLILGNPEQSLKQLETHLAQNTGSSESFFIAALAAYKTGNIIKSDEMMRQAVSLGLEWEDELPINIVVENMLSLIEFHDFENIYLDICEEIDEGNDSPNNRWFALNMPIYDYFTAPKDQEQKSFQLLAHIDPLASPDVLANGNEKLKVILNDLAASQTDARFGLEAIKLLEDNNEKELAKLILAMLLDHLGQFSQYIGLSNEFVKKSQLQNLVTVLPYRIAIIIMVLYTTTNPIESMQYMSEKETNNTIINGLLAACLTTFYQEIKKYQ